MNIWAIIPVKSLHEGKSRLSEVLSEEKRFQLNCSMLQNTINVLLNVDMIDEILVVSSDDLVFDLIKDKDLILYKEEVPELNHSITCASEYALQNEAQSVLILPADLPLLKEESVNSMISDDIERPFMVIAPDRKGSGTNGLYLSPFNNFIFHFGMNSLRLHLEEAKRLGYSIRIFRNESIGLDLDLPEDIDILSKTGFEMANYSIR